MNETSKHIQISSYELCSDNHPTGFFPPTKKEVKYVRNKQRLGKYQTKTTKRTLSIKDGD